MTTVSLKASGKDGLLSLSELRGELYNGNFNHSASLDVRPDSPQLKVQKNLSRVDAAKLENDADVAPEVIAYFVEEAVNDRQGAPVKTLAYCFCGF